MSSNTYSSPAACSLAPFPGRAWMKILFFSASRLWKTCSTVQRLSYWFNYSPPDPALESGKYPEKKMNQAFDFPTPISNFVSLVPWVGISLSPVAASTGTDLDSWSCPQVAKDPEKKRQLARHSSPLFRTCLPIVLIDSAAPWGFKWIIFIFHTKQPFSLFLAGVIV